MRDAICRRTGRSCRPSFHAPAQPRPPRAAPALAAAVLLAATSGLSAQDWEDYTYRLTESTGAYELWTTPPSERVFRDQALPSDSASGVKVYAAQNEIEPFLVVVRPASSGSLTVSIGDFGSGIGAEIHEVRTVNVTTPSDHLGRTGPNPDPLWPLSNPGSTAVTAGENTAFWFSLRIPAGTLPGNYTASVSIGGVAVPVTLHVFAFAVPEALHVKSQMNLSHQAILDKYGVTGTGTAYWTYVDAIKQYMIDHRLTPKSVLWSGGLTTNGAAPYIAYDCGTHTLSDPYGIWGFEDPAERYLAGTGLMGGQFASPFNGGTGFPSLMAATFRNNDASADQRPDSFCGQTRTASDWYTANNPSSPYNLAWFTYVAEIEDYLGSLGHLDEAYYYFANEPQDQADYDAVAWYSRHLAGAAPGLKLMVSEEPKPAIFEHADYVGDGQIDVWLPVLNAYDPEVSHDRQLAHGEATWIYFLYGTRPPFFNPITLDHPGVESKLTGWFLWKHRVEGIAYYAMNDWSLNPWTTPSNGDQNGDLFLLYPPSVTNTPIAYGSNGHRFVPSIRLELMRDGLEDYEYLYVLNGGTAPAVGVPNAADAQADRVIGEGTVSYTRSGEYLYNLRRLIGLKNGGEIATIPDISPPIEHPRSQGPPRNHYVNFQDPTGQPDTTYTEDTYGTGYVYRYVTYAGHDYLQVGTEEYSATAGFGWLDDTTNFLTGRDPWGDETDERRITYAYDDWGHHPGVWEMDVPNGAYRVEVSVGTPRTVRPHNRVVIEGVTFVDDEPSNMYIVRRKQVVVRDNKLTVDVGVWNEYTMLDYLDVEARGDVGIDFDGNGKADVFWRKQASGGNAVWQMDGTTIAGGDVLPTVGTPWVVAGAGDLDGNGKADLLWRNPTSGENAAWLMNGAAIVGGDMLTTVVPGWDIAGVGDFDGNGKEDLFWRSGTTGENAIWFMNGTSIASGALVSAVPAAWAARVGDLDGDGKADIFWFDASTGQAAAWTMDGATITGGDLLPTVAAGWAPEALVDFTDDGKVDVLWRNGAGDDAIWFLDGLSVTGGALLPTITAPWALGGAGDFDGDGKADILWRNTTTGDNAMWLMDGGTIASGSLITAIPDVGWNAVLP